MNTEWTVGNGVINATYTTANGVITAQYGAAGQLIGTEHYVGGQLMGRVDNTSNTVAAWSNALYQTQERMMIHIDYARDRANDAYGQLIYALWVEIGKAQEQIQLLVGGLNHLGSIDQIIKNALGVLGEMNHRLGNPLNVNTGESIGTYLQRDAIHVAQQAYNLQGRSHAVMIGQLAVLAGINYNQAFQYGHDITGFQHGGYIPRNMTAMLHAGEQVVPEWENRSGRGGRSITIQVYGGSKDPGQIADMVIERIERKSGRLQSTTIQTVRR